MGEFRTNGVTANGALILQSVTEVKPPRLVVIIDGVRFEVDDATADAGLVEEISRVIKGLFKILEKRAQKSATA